MKKLLCPLTGIAYYALYFAITFLIFTFLLPETMVNSIVAGVFIFLIDPFLASYSSSKTLCRIE